MNQPNEPTAKHNQHTQKNPWHTWVPFLGGQNYHLFITGLGIALIFILGIMILGRSQDNDGTHAMADSVLLKRLDRLEAQIALKDVTPLEDAITKIQGELALHKKTQEEILARIDKISMNQGVQAEGPEQSLLSAKLGERFQAVDRLEAQLKQFKSTLVLQNNLVRIRHTAFSGKPFIQDFAKVQGHLEALNYPRNLVEELKAIAQTGLHSPMALTHAYAALSAPATEDTKDAPATGWWASTKHSLHALVKVKKTDDEPKLDPKITTYIQQGAWRSILEYAASLPANPQLTGWLQHIHNYVTMVEALDALEDSLTTLWESEADTTPTEAVAAPETPATKPTETPKEKSPETETPASPHNIDTTYNTRGAHALTKFA